MKQRIVFAAAKVHNVNDLHDAFIASGLRPELVESTAEESRFTFPDEIADANIEAVIQAYIFIPKAPPIDLRAAALSYRQAVANAVTVPQLKAVMNGELMVLLRELAKSQIRDL